LYIYKKNRQATRKLIAAPKAFPWDRTWGKKVRRCGEDAPSRGGVTAVRMGRANNYFRSNVQKGRKKSLIAERMEGEIRRGVITGGKKESQITLEKKTEKWTFTGRESLCSAMIGE